MESNETSKWANKSDGNAASGSNGPKVALVAFAVVIVLAVVFFFQNSAPTRVKFLFFDQDTRVRSAIIVSIVVGVLLDRLISFWWRRRKRGNA